jgi:hypothetical protein
VYGLYAAAAPAGFSAEEGLEGETVGGGGASGSGERSGDGSGDGTRVTPSELVLRSIPGSEMALVVRLRGRTDRCSRGVEGLVPASVGDNRMFCCWFRFEDECEECELVDELLELAMV